MHRAFEVFAVGFVGGCISAGAAQAPVPAFGDIAGKWEGTASSGNKIELSIEECWEREGFEERRLFTGYGGHGRQFEPHYTPKEVNRSDHSVKMAGGIVNPRYPPQGGGRSLFLLGFSLSTSERVHHPVPLTLMPPKKPPSLSPAPCATYTASPAMPGPRQHNKAR